MTLRKSFLLLGGILTGHVLLAAPPNIALPPEESFHWGDVSLAKSTDTRASILLNGLWIFQPVTGDSTARPSGAWAAMRVPGSWDSQDTWDNIKLPSFVGQPPAWPGVEVRSENDPVRVYLKKIARGWYEREITIPADWAHRRILVNFERVSTDAIVSINGKKAGEVHWPGGEVDLTGMVSPGQTALLQVLVTAVASENELRVAMREDYAEKGDGGLRQRGIIGDVWLESEPQGAVLAPFLINTSVKDKRISVSGEVTRLAGSAPVKFEAVVREYPTGRVASTFSKDLTVEPGKPFQFDWSWSDPKLWDIGRPNLYTLALKIEGKDIKDIRTERFGFRELTIEGNALYFNGRKFRGRMRGANADQTGGLQESAEADFKKALKSGYTLLEIWPNDTFRRGFADFRADYATWADEAGILLLMPVIRTDDVFSWRQDPPPGEPFQKWLGANKRLISEVRNSPSVAGYLFFGNEWMTSDDQNPLRLGNRQALAQSQQQEVSPAVKLLDELRKFDPERFFGSHSGANVGDIQTVNQYLGLTPLQEQEETPGVWAKTGDMPYGAVEFSSPFSADMNRARMAWNTESEPLATEFLAAAFGPRSYEIESPSYRKHIRERFDLASGKFTEWPGKFDGAVGYNHYPPYEELQTLAFRRLWRSWRTWGVALGMIPWENPLLKREVTGEVALKPFTPGRRGYYFPVVPASWVDAVIPSPEDLTPIQRTYYEGIQPQIAYLGGPAQKDDWVAKDHHFVSGEKVRRSVVLINDGDDTMEYQFAWTLTGASEPEGGSGEGKIKAGESLIVPVEFVAPSCSKPTDLSLSLKAQFAAGELKVEKTDAAAIRIYPAENSAASKIPIVAFDPEGKTSRLLQSLGFSVTPWAGGPVPAGAVFVLGRNALQDARFPAEGFRKAVESGARAVIFSQDPDWLREKAGLRVHRWVGRQFWPVATQTSNPVVAGLDAIDLGDWNGSGSLVPPVNENNLSVSAKRKGYPTYGYRVGNRGSVSSAIWEKPHHSAWTPLLEGEFDMAYSPLMELSYGRGLVISCSLDVEDRNDPVARLIARRVIERAASAPLQTRTTVFYCGDPAGEKLLQSLTVKFSKVLGSVPRGSLLVVGPGSPSSTIQQTLASGGTVLALGIDHELSSFGITIQKEIYGAVPNPLPDWKELRGLSVSDLRLRVDTQIPLVQPAPGVEIAAGGLLARKKVGPGTLLVFQGNPSFLNAATLKYFRFSEWRWTRALSQILANLGASFSSDDAFFAFRPDPFHPIDLAGEWKMWVEKELPPSASPDHPSQDVSVIPKEPAPNSPQWQTVRLPGMNTIGKVNLEKIDGAFWFKKSFFIPADWKNRGDADLVLGVIDDHDTTFVNGNRVGGIGKSDPLAWSKSRTYRVPQWMLKPGQNNEISIRLFDQFGGGGFGAGDAPLSMRLALRKPPAASSYYVPGFQVDHATGDDPARYTRW